MEYLTRDSGGEVLIRSEEERVIEARLLRWGEVAQTPQGRERFIRGAFRGTDPATVSLEAIGDHGLPGARLTGRAIDIEERDDGPWAAFRVSRTAAGDELLELVRDRVYRYVSVVFAPLDGGTRIARDGVIERTRATLARVGIVERGAYPGAEVLAVRSDMTTETEPTPVPDPTPEPIPTPPPGTRVEVRSADAGLEALRSDMLGRMARLEARGGGGSAASPLARWATFGEYATAVYSDPTLARALVDQITSENPGVMGGWAGEVQGLLSRPRPAVTRLGGPRALGETGMRLHWPYLDPALDLDTVIAKQLAEKTDIASVKVKFLDGNSPIDTFAGGSDVSYQLIRRSDPAYREAYLRVLNICYARATEAEFETDLEAGAAGTGILTATATADEVRAFLFAASADVEDATGSPATVDLVSSAEFARLGGLAGLFPSAYGTSNIPGTAQASTLAINISGLDVIRAPFLTGNVHLVTNAEAAGWHEDGPFPISAEDVSKLGQNVAVWGMGATAIYVPAGIVKSAVIAGRSAGSKA